MDLNRINSNLVFGYIHFLKPDLFLLYLGGRCHHNHLKDMKE